MQSSSRYSSLSQLAQPDKENSIKKMREGGNFCIAGWVSGCSVHTVNTTFLCDTPQLPLKIGAATKRAAEINFWRQCSWDPCGCKDAFLGVRRWQALGETFRRVGLGGLVIHTECSLHEKNDQNCISFCGLRRLFCAVNVQCWEGVRQTLLCEGFWKRSVLLSWELLAVLVFCGETVKKTECKGCILAHCVKLQVTKKETCFRLSARRLLTNWNRCLLLPST